MRMNKVLQAFKRVLASTEELDILISSQLKTEIRESKSDLVATPIYLDKALKPEHGTAFIANICEPIDYKGRYYVCKEPCHFIGINKANPEDWKLIYCRKICDKLGCAGLCRKAVIKVEYIS